MTVPSAAALQGGSLFALQNLTLVTVDPLSGAETTVADLSTLGNAPFVGPLVASPQSSLIYGVATYCVPSCGGCPKACGVGVPYSEILTINPQTAAIQVSPLVASPLFGGIALDPATQTLWALTPPSPPGIPNANPSIAVVRVDPTTGAETVVATRAGEVDTVGSRVALDPASHVLYVTTVNDITGSGQLLALDTLTGTLSAGLNLAAPVSGLVYDASNATLFGVTAWATLVKIDPATGTETAIATFSGSFIDPTIDSASHSVFGVTYPLTGGDQIVTINDQTGAISMGASIPPTIGSLAFRSSDNSAPTVPGGVGAVAAFTPQVNLSWTASTDNVGVTGYTIYRNGAVLTTVSGTSLTYWDATVAGNTTYTYSVDAFDAAGNHSAHSTLVTVNTPSFAAANNLGGILTTGPATSSWSTSRTDVFVRGTDNGLWQRTWNGSTWSNWISLGGILTADPSAVSWGPNEIDVFVRGTDNGLWQRTWNGTTWSNWVTLGGILTSGPTVSSWGTNHLDVFVRGTDNGLWQRSWNGTSWSNWVALGGILTSDPAAVSSTANQIDVFVRGTDNGLWQRSFNGTSWSNWAHLGGILTSAPEAASCTANHLDVFVLGTDQGIWQVGYNGTVWSSWQSAGGPWTSDPAAVCSLGSTSVTLFVRGTNMGLWQATRPGT